MEFNNIKDKVRVGSIIRIKNIEWYKEYLQNTRKVMKGDFNSFVSCMINYLSKEAIVTEIFITDINTQRFYIDIDKENWYFSMYMIDIIKY